MTSVPEERRRRRALAPGFVGLGLGVFLLAIGFNRPTIANMRTVDLLHLVATGACLGAGLVAVVLSFVHPREG